MDELIVDVRTREEFAKEHIKGAINIPLYDLDFYIDFLKNKKAKIYCDTGRRAEMAKEKLEGKGIDSEVMNTDDVEKYEKERRGLICAVNYVSVRKGHEEEFEEAVISLCKATDKMPGFLGSKLLKVNGISAIGSGIPGDLSDVDIKPTKYIMLTYWESKEAHEKSHKHELFVNAFKQMPVYLTKLPYEEFYEILR